MSSQTLKQIKQRFSKRSHSHAGRGRLLLDGQFHIDILPNHLFEQHGWSGGSGAIDSSSAMRPKLRGTLREFHGLPEVCLEGRLRMLVELADADGHHRGMLAGEEVPTPLFH
eukprot:CAMPEP_0194759532 /NCGR_PEP_ID=MMETSP0323_2-20130528/12575_1 /TAXON_ID=2866 ORGANISM="Crypthecodinium cohnii, Strain Seligo" /NCGR_SAMPLE_ID=MMETSP0323_2 /ASSEMBLY_ACC=CAM_ASM_000346 /LENGTH=111 /DNA_ID=CAMNT_0039680315 /DNA_START=59 /DNA_END=394 /DNA_ORIENTATION=-